MPCEVRLKPSDLSGIPSEFIEFHILHRLKEAGAPVTGTFAPKLKTGVITSWTDDISQERVYRWEPND